jgi:hypothetical protein
MLLVLFALTTQGARRTSLTYDEPIYIAAGYSDFATGDLHWHHPSLINHPPRINVLATWPLLLSPSRPDPRTVTDWRSEGVLSFARALPPILGPLEAVTFATRQPIIWRALLLGALARRWAGQWAVAWQDCRRWGHAF